MDANRFKNTHRASVVAILGGEAPRVESRGSRFYNVDRWTARVLVKHMTDWAKSNPGATPSLAHVDAWVNAANAERVDPSAREIVIAETPDGDALTTRVAMALVGGGYHEAFHTRYSCRRTLSAREVADIVIPRWRKVADWSPLAGTLLEWGNLIEDIRIERRGNDEYPGAFIKLCDLQDLVLGQEAPVREKAKHDAAIRTMLVINGAFRDFGLGYDTENQDAVLRWYESADPAAYEMVTKGPLAPLLDEAIALSAADDLGHLRLAMDVIGALVQTGNNPNAMANGSRSHQGQGSGQGQQGQQGQGQGQGAGQQGQGAGQQGQQGQGQQGQQGQGQGQQGQQGQGAGQQGQGQGAGQGSGQGSGDVPSQHNGANGGAGGHYYDPGRVAQSYLTAAQWNSSGLKDGASALEAAVDHAKTRENKNCKKNEAPYRPFSTEKDKVNVAKPTSNGMASDRTSVEKMVQEIRSECSFLRARLRAIFRANEKVTVSHGVRHGRDLSDRTLVDSAVSLRGKEIPDRAYQRKSARVDNSLAAVVVLDQSASMAWGKDKLQNATKGVLAIVDALDALNCAVEAVGFRDGPYQSGDGGWYHRTSAIKIDVFKGFNERFCSVKHRFAAARAEGGTPMADGLQHGINSLQNRREGHRVIFVVTDGEPNTGHGPVIRRQIRLAREANVHVIGVGIGNEAAYVLETFDDAVHVQDIKELPSALIRKLNDIIDVRRVKVAGNNRKIAME